MGLRSFIHSLTAPPFKHHNFTDENIKMVLVVNNELKMGKGKIAAQVGHAAVSLTLKCGKKAPGLLESWLKSGQKKICVKADNAEHLLKLEMLAISSGILSVKIHDAGHTQIPSGSLTVLALGPDTELKLSNITDDLKLL
jgi:PTH2 family peptidyl-tRNA hydrolase